MVACHDCLEPASTLLLLILAGSLSSGQEAGHMSLNAAGCLTFFVELALREEAPEVGLQQQEGTAQGSGFTQLFLEDDGLAPAQQAVPGSQEQQRPPQLRALAACCVLLLRQLLWCV